MKIIFMGTPEIAVPTLEKLINSRHEVCLVVTRPDQKSGRGMNIKYSPVKETALKYGIEIIQPESISEEWAIEAMRKEDADVIVVAAYSQKIPEAVLNLTPHGCINLHPSLLPKYRGAEPLQGPILNGDEKTGVSIIYLVEKWDAGDILLQQEISLDKKETLSTLEPKLAALGADMMLSAVSGLEDGTITATPQDESRATYLKQMKKEDGLIDFNDSAVNIERKIRALNPWPSAFTFLEGKTFKIWDADVVPEDISAGDDKDMPAGSVLKGNKQLIVKTGDGCLELKSVQLEGKKRMDAEDFLRGKKIERGLGLGK